MTIPDAETDWFRGARGGRGGEGLVLGFARAVVVVKSAHSWRYEAVIEPLVNLSMVSIHKLNQLYSLT